MNDWFKNLSEKIGLPDLIERLSDRLSGSELNTLLMALFDQLTRNREIADLKEAFHTSRFFKPSVVDPVLYKTLEISCLNFVKTHGYNCIELSPLAPLGTTSVLAPINQNTVVSALRGSEIVSDATNVLALVMTSELNDNPDVMIKYACTHRHTRAQALSNPAFTAHFGVFCLTSAAKDTGDFLFEMGQFKEHIHIHHQLLKNSFPDAPVSLKVMVRNCPAHYSNKLKVELLQTWDKSNVEWIEPATDNRYYPVVQFKLKLNVDGQWMELADGGLVDWTQKLMQNQKHRMMISGLGLELVYKLKSRPDAR